MTYVPAPLSELQKYMQQKTGLPLASLGVFPDENHDGGYHCGWDRRRIRNGQLSDYSWQESPRDWNHKTDAARAFDCGMFPLLRELSIWMVGECAIGAPDTLDIREIIYSPDGVNVYRWDRLGIRSTGDSSHQTHTHFSYFADAEHRDKVSPFRRFFEGGGMPADQGDHNVGYYIQNGVLGLEEPIVHVPAENGFDAFEVPNPLATALKALVTGTDAHLPALGNIAERVWKNDTAMRLAALEAKIDHLLAIPPGTMNPDTIRSAVRAELNATKLGPLT